MKRLSFLWCGVLLGLCLGVTGARAQMGPGMMGMHGNQVAIPEKLPTPKSGEWINKLRQILVLEKLSRAQYEADREKYQVNRPYMMVISQEENHVEWIGRLFSAYGLPADGRMPPVEQSQSLEQAYKIALKLEGDLILQYQTMPKTRPLGRFWAPFCTKPRCTIGCLAMPWAWVVAWGTAWVAEV